MSFDWQMPKDPFADDDFDPASLFDDEEEQLPPLSDQEREQIKQELQFVYQFRAALLPKGVMGVVAICEECQEEHYYDWDIMINNMRATLAGELSPAHEPSMNPNPNAYVPWDYCLGYIDGMSRR
ncbi:DUF5319 domain-containing protein [Corynebacterium pseudopelargi]|uniref:DUF5319 domain-containing protein n=1 Tax=Corynebacterium pseudopelargi TaxID=2080757 RepID=A0A3G6IWI8_9CORY|nr:DUF5319 domain-containing protein [Corynebacterium pseudopelargi]AZA09923.1 hypothetical protein CPPEL_09100 [Corynebacterium pseudopelargi]